MGALKNIWDLLDGDEKVKGFCKPFGKGVPIIDNINAYYKRKDDEREYDEMKKKYYMQKRIEEEYEKTHGRGR